MIGTLIAAWDGWRGNMYRLAVAVEERPVPAWVSRSSGPARSICAIVARRITALVGAEDEGALALWRAADYGHDRQVSRFVRNP